MFITAVIVTTAVIIYGVIVWALKEMINNID